MVEQSLIGQGVLRDRSLITGRGEGDATKQEGQGQVQFYHYKKKRGGGGAEKVEAMMNGGHNKFQI